MKKVTIFDEFKIFVSRGNMVDVAIAVVMGTAFTKLVNALVSYLISPCISLLIGNAKLSTLAYKHGETVIRYGLVIESAINFLILTIIFFLMVKTINSMRAHITGQHIVIKKEPSEIQLLKEIRQDLKTKVEKIKVKPAAAQEKNVKNRPAKKQKKRENENR